MRHRRTRRQGSESLSAVSVYGRRVNRTCRILSARALFPALAQALEYALAIDEARRISGEHEGREYVVRQHAVLRDSKSQRPRRGKGNEDGEDNFRGGEFRFSWPNIDEVNHSCSSPGKAGHTFGINVNDLGNRFSAGRGITRGNTLERDR